MARGPTLHPSPATVEHRVAGRGKRAFGVVCTMTGEGERAGMREFLARTATAGLLLGRSS